MIAQGINDLTVDCDGTPTTITLVKSGAIVDDAPAFRETYNRLRLLDVENSQQPHLN